MKDILLVTVDCWRADSIDKMPILRSLTQKWNTASAVTQSTATYGAFSSILASQYYPQIYDTNGEVTNSRTVPAVLSDHGYNTAGFVAANPFLNRWAESFDTFWNDRMDATDDSDSALRSVVRKGKRVIDLARMRDRVTATDVVERAEKWWQRTPRPRFLWMHLMDLHEPYLPTLGGLSRPHTAHYSMAKFYLNRWSLDEKTIRGVERLYNDCIPYLDDQLSGLDRFLDDDPVVVMTGDHGEAFSHGIVGHARIYDETATVPYLSTLDHPTPEFVRHLDIPPTILDALEIPIPDRWEGAPIDGSSRDSFIMNVVPQLNETYLGLRTDSHKLIHRFDSSTGTHNGTELYDLTEDPHEQAPTEDTDSGVRSGLEERIEVFLAREDIDRDVLNIRPMETSSKAAEERLKDLGYI